MTPESQAATDFDSYMEFARTTERRVDQLLIDGAVLQRLIQVAVAVASLVDIYKQSLYHHRPVQIDLVNWQLEEVRESLGHLQDALGAGTAGLACDQDSRLLLAAIGVFTEAGELLEACAPVTQGHPVNHDDLREELGDILWYQAVAIDALETRLSAVLATNMAKLRIRYNTDSASGNLTQVREQVERPASKNRPHSSTS